ncbi:MAG: ABC transporter substrate-binding protein [Desulfobacterota bacterium]|nr:ABC transporter substrate-binding protein [Thermodesulfobacteriota bacterium]
MHKAIIGLGAALFLVSLLAGPAAAAGPPAIRIGVVLPLSGPHVKFGEIEKNSFLLAEEEINAAGGINGKRVQLLFEDDGSRFERGRAAAEKLVTRDQVVALTGGYSSPVAFAVASLAQKRRVPFLVTTGSADEITEQGWEYVFRLNPPVSEYARALIDFLQEVVKPTRVAVIYEDSLFGQSGSREFIDEALEKGWKIVLNAGYAPGAADFKPLLSKARAARADLVYLVSYVNEAARFMLQAREVDFSPRLFTGAAAGLTLPEFSRLAGEAAENVVSASLWTPHVPYPGAREYAERYRKKFGHATEYHGAEAYASVQVLADALKRARDLTPEAIREALVKTNLMTAFGPVKFTSYGNKRQQNSLPTYAVQWQQGTLETIWPAPMATKPYIYPLPARKK